MPAQVTNYQCPACTGPLRFSGETGKLQCEYCGSSFDVAEIEALYEQKDEAAAAAKQAADAQAAQEKAPAGDGWDTSDLNDDWGADADGMRAYSCPSCGAELICDETTAATSCPYCGNPTVVPGQFAGTLRPDFVLPFQVTKDDAVRALKEHYKGKPFLPRPFTQENKIQEIRGVYVPFWMFDGEAEGSASYETTIVRRYDTSDEEITETSYYNVFRSGSVAFEKVPVDASSKMPDDHMDSIEPFDYSALRPFSTAYLPGYLADKYDVSVEDSRERADERCASSLEGALRKTVTGYATVRLEHKDVRLRRGKVHYALLPVWMLNTKWNGKDFLFAMNGQTGKLVGDLPMSWGKFWATFAGTAVAVGAIAAAVLRLLM